MRRIMAVVGVACLLLCQGCAHNLFTSAGIKRTSWNIQDAEQARERARTSRAEAAGLRQDAHEYELVMEITRDHIHKHHLRIKALKEKRKKSDAAICSVAIKDERARVQMLKQQLADQRRLRSAYLWDARQREADADVLDGCAARLGEE